MASDRPPRAERVRVTGETLVVDLSDGRTVIAPLVWYPRLLHARPDERKKLRLIARGEGIHWPDLDEDISVDGLLKGLPSGESQSSFNRWLALRAARRSNTPRQRPVPGRRGGSRR